MSFITNIKRVKTALFSGKKAAYLGIITISLSPITSAIDHLFSTLSSKKNNRPDRIKGIVIVSNGRSGSTVVYQTLVRTIPSVYVSNLHVFFPHMATYWMKKFNRYGCSRLSRNYYGYTPDIYDVNEANKVWAKLFRGNPTKSILRKRFINLAHSLGADEDHPIILKNILASDRINLLHEAIPELFFLKLSRGVVQHAQSHLQAYYDLGSFSPEPEKLRQMNTFDPPEMAVVQVLEVNKQIDMSLKHVNPLHVVRWTYESFCENFEVLIKNFVHDLLDLPTLKLDTARSDIRLKASRSRKVNIEQYNKIIECYERSLQYK